VHAAGRLPGSRQSLPGRRLPPHRHRHRAGGFFHPCRRRRGRDVGPRNRHPPEYGGAGQMIASLPRPGEYFVDRLRELQVRLRDEVRRQQERLAVEEMSRIQEAREGDTIYAIDVHAEELLFTFCEEWGRDLPLVLIAEGIGGSGARVFPEGAREEDAAFRLLVDPIDGTRVLMYNKRSAWSLAGVAPNLGPETRLCDI